MTIAKSERRYHLIAWAIWILMMTLNVGFQGPSLLLYIISPILYYSAFIAYFYLVSLYVLPRYWPKHFVKLVVSFVILFSVFLSFRYYTIYEILPLLDDDFQVPVYSLRRYFLAQILQFLQITMLAVGYFVYKKSIEVITKENEMEKSLIRAETSFLMAQFNPHFLFNILSYMYSKAARVSDELSSSIELLAEIMRYSLKDTNPGDRVFLTDEVEHIENFIELNRLRFENNMYIDWKVEGDLFSKRIIPLVLISQVENAFKHGMINDPKHPLKMHLIVDKEQMVFQIRNKKKASAAEVISHGIGNKNVAKRLELAYGNRATQTVNETNEDYSYHLVIKDQSL